MAVIDAVMADERAKAIIAKYRERDWADGAPAASVVLVSLLTEMQSDIANAINAAIAESYRADRDDLLAKQQPTLAEVEASMAASKRNTTHMPSTGHDKRRPSVDLV